MRALVLLALAGCSDLPDLGVCGNGIVEAANGEACDDGSPSEACTASCELACQTAAFEDYVQVRADQSETLFCPDATFACGIDRICRQPGGAFAAPASPLAFDVRHVPVVGDFDGDDYDDVIGTSATSIFVRFGGVASTLLANAHVQEAPSSTSPLVIFDLANPMLPSSIHVAAPTEGVALLRSDTERFAPQLDFINTQIPTDRIGAVVRDPDSALGDVMIAVAVMSGNADIGVARLPAQIGQFPGIGAAQLPACSGVAAGAWRLVDIEVAGDRTSFVIVTAKTTAPPAWHVCRYTHSGNQWALSSSLEVNAPPPVSTTLANLDLDACDELLVANPMVATYARVDATGVDCGFAPGLATFTDDISGDTPNILGSGQIIPGGTEEIVTTQGVLELGASDFTRRIAPSTQNAWTEAALTDLNGDGAIDVVAARAMQDDVDVVRGGATLNVYRSDTASVVTGALAGDFDGDRLGDVALVETTGAGDRVSVAFGTRDGILDTPRAMSDFGGKLKLHRLALAPWIPTNRGKDGVDDLFVVRTSGATASAGLSMGDAARLLTTPRFPPSVTQIRDLGAIVAGRIGSPDIELLAIAEAGTNTIVQLYNVMGNAWAPELVLMADVRPPLASLRGPNGQGFAAGLTGSETTPSVVTFSARSPMPTCMSTTLAAAPREMRAADLDGDSLDELVVYTGEGPTRGVQVYRIGPCPASRLAQDALDGCVDVARVGAKLFALCRIAPAPQARGIYELGTTGDTLSRAPIPVHRVDGDGRFLTVGDFDGDGVPDLAVGTSLGTEINLQTLRQCPAHDLRSCG